VQISWDSIQESQNNIKNIPTKFVYWRMQRFEAHQNMDQRGAVLSYFMKGEVEKKKFGVSCPAEVYQTLNKV
jgi:hypothetical protein